MEALREVHSNALCTGLVLSVLEMAFQIARAFGVPLDKVFRYPDSPE